MNIFIADKAGYCFGVQRAMNLVEKTIHDAHDTVYCLGDLSHNRQEMERLKKEGVVRVDTLDEIKSGTVLIRAHGEAENVLREAEAKGLTVVNTTCPFVRALQNKVREYTQKGYEAVIVGKATHPEVIGVVGHAKGSVIVVETPEEAQALTHEQKRVVVVQTTFIEKKFYAIAEIIQNQSEECLIFNTICSATAERQQAAAELAKRVQYMIVVGGYHSSNTQKLFEVCRVHCKNTRHIETVRDLDLSEVRQFENIGITAGASTPDWLVKEVTESMEENKLANEQIQETETVEETVQETVVENAEAVDVAPVEEAVEEKVEEATEETAENDEDVSDENFDFASALDEEPTQKVYKNAVVEGEVILVNDDEIILNIGSKADAVIKKNDYIFKTDEALPDLVKVGDKITAIVVDTKSDDGSVKLSKVRYDSQKMSRKLEEAYNNEEILEGVVKSVSGSGLIVDIGFSDIFMPASQYGTRYIKDLETLVGKNVRGKIIDFNRRRRRAIFSQRVILEKEQKERQRVARERKEQRFAELEVDQTVTGKVKTITSFGIFVDLDGIDGFVHRSDLTWARANEPKDIVEKGETIEAKVISKNDEEKKIKLSVKALQPKPWDSFIAQYKEGDEVEVKITNVLDFGAFAEIIPGVEGLIHVSAISYDRVESVASVLSPGDVVKVKIIGIDTEKEKISLSIKATLEAPERPQRRRRRENAGEGGYEKRERRGGGRKRPQNTRNATVYEESANVTLGDTFGSLFAGLSFDEEAPEETTTSEEATTEE